MRTIKFRAWDEKYKYMNYKVIVGMWGEDVLDDENYTACSMWIEPEYVDYKCEPHWGHFEPYHSDIKLMQFTGMKDKNDKEVYEGDIIKLTSDSILNRGLDEVGIIVYDESEGMYCLEGFDGVYMDEFYNGNTIIGRVSMEVIGNRYENKDILEKYEFEF